MADVTEEQIEEYQRDGAVVLKNIFTDEWIELIQQGIDMNIQSPSQYSEWLTVILALIKLPNKVIKNTNITILCSILSYNL